jgi:hypothetical protein
LALHGQRRLDDERSRREDESDRLAIFEAGLGRMG